MPRFCLDPGPACPLPLPSGHLGRMKGALGACGNTRCESSGDFSQTLVQDTVTPSLTTRAGVGAGRVGVGGGGVLRQLLGCCPQEMPSWAVGMALFFPPSSPALFPRVPLPASKLVSTGVPHLAGVFFDDHPPKPSPPRIFEEDKTICLWLSVFFHGPGPVVLLAAGLALALLLAAGLCPCQERASGPGTRVEQGCSEPRASLPCPLLAPAFACKHSCLAGRFPGHQDTQSLLRSVSSCLSV